MVIDVYNGISREEIAAQRVTSEGKVYSLFHSEALIVNMRYKGEGKANTNSQGWERSSTYYFKELQEKHPEIFSKKNKARIERGESPRVDACFVRNFPQYKGYENDTLIHHHVGKDGQAVAVPQSIHKGSGEIHIYEDELGITENARHFSDKCKSICDRSPQMIGQTSDRFKGMVLKKDGGVEDAQSNNAISRAVSNEKATGYGVGISVICSATNNTKNYVSHITIVSQDKARS